MRRRATPLIGTTVRVMPPTSGAPTAGTSRARTAPPGPEPARSRSAIPRSPASRRARGDAGTASERSGASTSWTVRAVTAAMARPRLRRRLRRGLVDRAEPHQQRPDRNNPAGRDDDLIDDALLPDLDVDVGLLGLDACDDLTTLHPVADLDEPLDDRPLVHVGTERRHRIRDRPGGRRRGSFDHSPTSINPMAASAMSSTCGIA